MAAEIPSGAVEVVRAFLTCTVDAPDEAKARGLLSKASLTGGDFRMPEFAPGQAHYVIGEALVEGGQVYVPVTLKDGATGTEMTMPLAPVQEEGAWKLDMGKMVDRLMGGVMQQVAQQMGDAMGVAVEGVGEALAAALGGPGAAGSGTAAAADVERIAKKVAEIQAELEKKDLSVVVEVDAESLLRGEDAAANEVLAGKLVEEVLRNFAYAVTEAHRHIPLEGRVKVIRVEGVREARDRVVYAEGARIIYRLALGEEEGFYDGQALAERIAGAAAGMAETALPGDVGGKKSYEPQGDGEAIVRDYREFVAPVLMQRMSEMLGREVKLEMDWDIFAGDAEEAKGLWTWGLNRICGAIGILSRIPEVRAALAEEIEAVRLLPAAQKEMKSIERNGKELVMYFAPVDGEAGGFSEGELAEILSAKLKLRTRPMVAELERYAKHWEEELEKLFGVRIQYAFDWDGFTCKEDEAKNAFALTQLREHGIDAMYYALAGLAEKNPNFKQQLPQRVRWIYLEHVPRAEKKGVLGEQTTLALKLFLHEGYAGYLTLKELEKALPGIVAGMPDIA